jgi:hypothetical protein
MPGTIVNALMKRFREDHGNLPFLPMAMDGQEQSGSRIRLEAFMHQVTQFRDQREFSGRRSRADGVGLDRRPGNG